MARGLKFGGPVRSIYFEVEMDAWVVQRAADLGVSIAEVVRMGVERAMAADPVTSDATVNGYVADYMRRGFTQRGGDAGHRGSTGGARRRPDLR